MQGVYLSELGYGFVKKCVSIYCNGIPFIVCSLVILLYLFYKKNKETECIVTYSIFLVLTVYNPIVIKIFWGYLNEDTTYYRMLWLFPASIILTYVIVKFASQLKNVKERIIFLLVVSLIIITFGIPQMNMERLFRIPENLWMVEDDVLAIDEFIHDDGKNEEVRIATTSSITRTIRQYDPTVILAIDSDDILAWQGVADRQHLTEHDNYKYKKVVMDTLLRGDMQEPNMFSDSVEYLKIDYIVFECTNYIDAYVVSLNFEFVGNTEKFKVYKYKKN